MTTIELLSKEFQQMIVEENKTEGDYCILLVSTSNYGGYVIHRAYKSIDDFLRLAREHSDEIDPMFGVGFEFIWFE